MRKILLLIISLTLVFTFSGCKKNNTTDDNSCLNAIRNAINKLYENNETITTNNVQKYMVGNWIIIEAPKNMTREDIPRELDPTTADIEWTTMYITTYNTKTEKYKELRIFKDEDGKLYVGSETDAYVTDEVISYTTIAP